MFSLLTINITLDERIYNESSIIIHDIIIENLLSMDRKVSKIIKIITEARNNCEKIDLLYSFNFFEIHQPLQHSLKSKIE